MNKQSSEIIMKHINGILPLLLSILLAIASVAGVVWFFIDHTLSSHVIWASVFALVASIVIACGIKIVRPQEALVFTFFGNYSGTLKQAGIFFVNPLSSAFKPTSSGPTSASVSKSTTSDEISSALASLNKTISLKTKTINNDKQKINDLLGNPIIIDTMVVWRVKDTAKAMFDVDNYVEYLSSQCDSALRNIISLYPYDTPDDESGVSLRSSTSKITDKLQSAIQEKVDIAGLEIVEARITNMYYAPEIASAMLQRQQAQAIIDAKQTIVEGAVDIVDMALTRLSQNNIVDLDEERKAAMVSNLLVVLCGNKDAQPIVNSGSLY